VSWPLTLRYRWSLLRSSQAFCSAVAFDGAFSTSVRAWIFVHKCLSDDVHPFDVCQSTSVCHTFVHLVLFCPLTFFIIILLFLIIIIIIIIITYIDILSYEYIHLCI